MTKIVPPTIFPAPIPSGRFAQNGDIPSPTALRRVAHSYNLTATSRKKVLFTKSYATQSTPSMGGPSRAVLYFSFRTSDNVKSIGMLLGMAPASQVSGSAKARARIVITKFSGGALASPYHYYPRVQSGTYTPSEVAWNWSEIETSLEANTLYWAKIEQYDYSRIHSAMVYEIASPVADSTVTSVADPTEFEEAKPVYDASIQALAEAGTKLWQHNACTLVSFSRHDDATSPTINNTAYRNILETGTGTVSATTRGFHVNTQYHDSQKGDVPIEMGVYAVLTSGSGTLDLKFVTASGDVIEITGIADSTWTSAQGTMTAGSSVKTDIHAKINTGGATWDIYSACLWEYET